METWYQKASAFQKKNWQINMEPQNGGLEDDVPFQTDDFQVPCYLQFCLGLAQKLAFYNSWRRYVR